MNAHNEFRRRITNHIEACYEKKTHDNRVFVGFVNGNCLLSNTSFRSCFLQRDNNKSQQ